jgi:hypothetical protein
MRAILLENDILIAEAWDVKWSGSMGLTSKCGKQAAVLGEGFQISCENHFVKNFFREDQILNCLLIFENLDHKYLYGLKPISIVRDEKYSKIEFIMNYFLSRENISEDFKNKWLMHNRNQRIKQILKE